MSAAGTLCPKDNISQHLHFPLFIYGYERFACMHVCVPYCLLDTEARRVLDPFELQVSCELPCVCWAPNPDLL